MDGRQWDRAMASSLQWLAAAPEDMDAHFAAGRCHLNLDNYAEAARHLNWVLQANPTDNYALRLLAIASFEMRDYKTADRAIEDALSLNPLDSWHWYQLGSMCQRWRDLEAAKLFLREAESLAPRESAIVKLQAFCEPECSMERLRLVRRALELDPEDPALHQEMGKFYFLVMRDFARAEACYRQALALAPTVKSYRAGLFAAVRHRDWIYACLSAPGRWLQKLVGWSIKLEKVPNILLVITFPVWLYAGMLLFSVTIAWGATFMPLAAAYEWLTLKDIATRAGELERPRRRWYLIRTWPFAMRMSLLTLFGLAVWTLAILWYADGEAGLLFPAFVVGGLMIYGLIKLMRRQPGPSDTVLPLRSRPPEIQRLYQKVAESQSPKGAANSTGTPLASSS